MSFIIAIVFATGIVLWQNGSINPNKKGISHGVYLEKNENNTYTALYGRNQSLVAIHVDSVIITKRYGIIIHGIGEDESSKFWYYVNTSNELFGGWNDSIFRSKGIFAVGNKYLDSIETIDMVWNKN